jgi:hypothetical protein
MMTHGMLNAHSRKKERFGKGVVFRGGEGGLQGGRGGAGGKDR